MSKTRRGGAASVVESSAWGSDDTGLDSVSGSIHTQYIDALRRTKKKAKAPLVLPPEWMPEVRWVPVQHVASGNVPPAREGHALVSVMAPRPGSAPPSALGCTVEEPRKQVLDSLYVIGGKAGTSIYRSTSPDLPSRPGSRSDRVDRRPITPRPQADRAPEAPRAPRHDMGIVPFQLTPGPGGAAQAEWGSARGAALPQRLAGPCAVALAGGALVAVFGGLCLDTGQASDKLYVLNVANGVWRNESAAPGGPGPCIEHAATDVDGGAVMLVHGGRNSAEDRADTLSSMHRLDLRAGKAQWHEVAPAIGSGTEALRGSVLATPPARRAHSLCAKGSGVRAAYIFGGYNTKQEVCQDLHVLDLERNIFLAVESAGALPVARAYHTAVRLGPYMVVYGGINATGAALGELRILHLPTLMWAAPEVHIPGSPTVPAAADESSPTTTRRQTSPDKEDKSRKAATKGDDMMATESIKNRKPLGAPQKTEPGTRSRHAAIALAGAKPGECAMLIFGGRGAQGLEPMRDAWRLALQLPREGEPGCGEKKHPDKAYEFVMGNLQESLVDSQKRHEEQIEDFKERQKEMREEVRNLETRALAVAAEAGKHQAKTLGAQNREAALRQQIVEEEAKLVEIRKDSKARLRELEIEVESLLAKVQRMQGEQSADFEGLTPVEEIDLDGSAPVGKLPNCWTPTGFVDRRDTRWRGARATVEVIKFNTTVPQPTTFSSPRRSSIIQQVRPASGRRKSAVRSPSPTTSKGSTSAPSSPSRSVSPLPNRSGSRASGRASYFSMSVEEDEGAAMEVALWGDALRAELKVVCMLRHPNLQEIYGAALNQFGAYMLSEPYPETLASRLNREGRRVSAGVAFGAVAAASPAPLTGGQRLHVSGDLSAGLAYLHSKGVAHRHVVVENAFITDQGGVSLLAKLGGHLAARVACRARGEPSVPTSGVRPAGSPTQSEPLRRMADVDARPTDVRGLGAVLLRMWLSQDFQRRPSAGPARMEEEVYRHLDEHAPLEELGLIRDGSIRLVVASCFFQGAERPSASLVRRALADIQAGDLTALPTLEHDPSREARLADIAVDPVDAPDVTPAGTT